MASEWMMQGTQRDVWHGPGLETQAIQSPGFLGLLCGCLCWELVPALPEHEVCWGGVGGPCLRHVGFSCSRGSYREQVPVSQEREGREAAFGQSSSSSPCCSGSVMLGWPLSLSEPLCSDHSSQCDNGTRHLLGAWLLR